MKTPLQQLQESVDKLWEEDEYFTSHSLIAIQGLIQELQQKEYEYTSQWFERGVLAKSTDNISELMPNKKDFI